MGCVHCNDNYDKCVAALLDVTSTEVTGNAFDEIGSLMKSDGAAIVVSRALDMEDNEGCDMHDGEKIGCAAICRLTRSKNNIIINVF